MKTIGKILKHMHAKDWVFLIIGVALIVLQTFFEIKLPESLGKCSELLGGGITDPWPVVVNALYVILWAVASFGAAILIRIFLNCLAANFSTSLREDLYRKVLSLDEQGINKLTTPSLVTRTTLDISQIQFVFSQAIYVLVKSPVMAIWAIVAISKTGQDISFTVAVLIFVILIVVVFLIIATLITPKIKRLQKLNDDLTSVSRESITGVRVIRAFNAEEFHTERSEKINKNYTKTNTFIERGSGFLSPFVALINTSMIVVFYIIAAITMGSLGVLSDKARLLGNLTMFTQHAMNIITSFMAIVVIFIFLPRAYVSMKRINEVFDAKSKIKYPKKGIEKEINGDIEFNNVTFTYPNASTPAVKNVSFKIKSGEKFAIIGATGSSKTTIIKLLLRNYDIDNGSILLENNDIKTLSKTELRNHISVAPQKALLFSGTIKSNITYGSSYDEERLKKAIEIAQASFIYKLEKGINAPVSQGGTNFSGGQKQRISLARAIYRKSKVIIFDDTFSALDFKTDMLARKAINENLKDVTTITISQRIGSIKNSDKILVIENGEAVGLGKHDDLIKNCPIYKEIALSQLDKEEI